MSMRSRLFYLVTLCALAVPAAAQQKSVTVDLATGEFKQAVPFDEEFWLIGTNDKTAQKVELTYGKVGKGNCAAEKQSGVCDLPPKLDDPKESTNAGTATTFKFRIEKLAPRACYTFHIKQHLAPAGDDDRKKVREVVAKAFREKLTAKFKNGTLVEQELKDTEKDLQELAKSTVKSQLLSCLGDDVVKLTLDDAKDALALNTRLSIAKKNADDRRIDVLKGLCLVKCATATMLWAKSFRDDLAALLADPSVLTPASAEQWKWMAPVARALVRSTDDTLKELIEGKRKIVDADLEPSVDPDLPSLRLLGNFLEVYTDSTFRKKTGGGTEPVVEPGLAAGIRGEIPVRDLAAELAVQATSKAQFEALGLPDILANQVLTRGYDLSAAPTVVTEGKNAYIGVDAGLGYAFNLDKPYVYAGANFYMVPINKDEKDVPYWDITKRGSLLLGLASTVDGTKNLVGPGSPMLGVGYRVSRYVKFSGGWIVFKQRDENPLIEKDRVKVEPFFSMSIDTDLKTLLTGFGKLFGG